MMALPHEAKTKETNMKKGLQRDFTLCKPFYVNK